LYLVIRLAVEIDAVRITLLTLFLLTAFLANEAQGEEFCRVHRLKFNITSEGPWPARMTVKAGNTFGSRRWRFGSTTPSRLYLVTQAKHGRVSLSHPGGYHYSPANGYVGSDSFTLKVCGTKNGGYQGCANIQFEVSVVAQSI
jgi:hypothetical protein